MDMSRKIRRLRRIFNEIHNGYEEFQSPLTALSFVK